MYSIKNVFVYLNNHDLGRFKEVIIDDCEAKLYDHDGLQQVIQFDSFKEDYHFIHLYQDEKNDQALSDLRKIKAYVDKIIMSYEK